MSAAVSTKDAKEEGDILDGDDEEEEDDDEEFLEALDDLKLNESQALELAQMLDSLDRDEKSEDWQEGTSQILVDPDSPRSIFLVSHYLCTSMSSLYMWYESS